MKKIVCILFCTVWFFSGCDNTDLTLVADAGVDAIKAVTLSDEDVKLMAVQASRQSDSRQKIAPVQSPYGKRLVRLAGKSYADRGYQFNFKVYLSKQVNAFAMADGTIRIYSGLMDMMNDDELLFVVGHEIGHVVKKHIKKKIKLAYAASAVRKTVSSQEGLAGDIARSGIGGLMQALLNAQFSQEEERQADDYGIYFLKEKKRDLHAAVTALRKLSALGKGHSFLSSHPAPAQRAKRLMIQVKSPEKIGQPTQAQGVVKKIKTWIVSKLNILKGR